MARISASVYTSHVPAVGAALDLGKTTEPYWQPVFEGYDFSKKWLKEQKPDVIFLVYNDHANAFSLDLIRVHGGLITEVVSFLTPETFGRFGFPDEVS